MSNRNRAFPKAYIEAFETPGKYTVGVETCRLITSGLSEAQFNDFLEHAFLVLTSSSKNLRDPQSHRRG